MLAFLGRRAIGKKRGRGSANHPAPINELTFDPDFERPLTVHGSEKTLSGIVIRNPRSIDVKTASPATLAIEPDDDFSFI